MSKKRLLLHLLLLCTCLLAALPVVLHVTQTVDFLGSLRTVVCTDNKAQDDGMLTRNMFQYMNIPSMNNTLEMIADNHSYVIIESEQKEEDEDVVVE